MTTSNLPWFMDLTFQVPMQYCSLQHQTLLPSPVTSTTGCFFVCLFWPCLFILSGVKSPFFSRSILGTYRPGEFIFQCPICLPFHTVHEVLKARILKCFAIPFYSGPCFVRNLRSTFRKRNHGIQSHHFMANRWGDNGNSERLYLFIYLAPKSLQIVTAPMKLKDAWSLGEKLWPA